MSHEEDRTCVPFIGIHNGSASYNNLPIGVKQTMFEDFTDNHNKTSVVADSNNPLTITIITKNGKKIERTIDESARFSIQVEDIKKVSITCNATSGTCSGFVDIFKTFCIEC